MEEWKSLRCIRFFVGALLGGAAWSQQNTPLDPAAVQPFQAYVTAAEGDVSINRDNRPWALSSGGIVPIQQVITTVLQVAMFVTPIFWSADQLGGRARALVDFNLLYHLVDVVRAPLLGHAPSTLTYFSVLAAALLGWSLTFVVFSRFRRRIPYWI